MRKSKKRQNEKQISSQTFMCSEKQGKFVSLFDIYHDIPLFFRFPTASAIESDFCRIA